MVFIVALHKNWKRIISYHRECWILEQTDQLWPFWGVLVPLLQGKVLYILSIADLILILVNVLQPLNGIYWVK